MKKTTLTRTRKRIALDVPEDLLKYVDRRAPLEDLTREELILEAVRRFLKPHLKAPVKAVTNAISESTDKLKTGRYEP